MNQEVVSYTVRGRVAIVTMDRTLLKQAWSSFACRRCACRLPVPTEEAGASAIVLTGTERAFSAGADITEFNMPAASRDPARRS